MSSTELPFDRKKRKLKNRFRDPIPLVRVYTTPTGIEREVFLHPTKGFRDRRAS
jgi:hypothetical protein